MFLFRMNIIAKNISVNYPLEFIYEKIIPIYISLFTCFRDACIRYPPSFGKRRKLLVIEEIDEKIFDK